ncbi:MAG TPA: sulfate/molybdate ABC transporter ATP-binding protein [Candidatus Acidoferrales bacterium]|nr:sulfate/molybdate ABC transporter ATP-binding protein [Candidatus Acidoferrales bacterium]
MAKGDTHVGLATEDMALEVQIEKKLPEFTLRAAFRADSTPLSILGPSGAGKTMLLRCLAGLAIPNRGRIALDGDVLFDSERHVNLPARARRLGLLFQHFALFPHRTVAENIGFGLAGLEASDQQKRVRDLIERTHAKGLEQRFPRELSGGEQQRVALARALAIEPRALLLDEPLSALDTHLRSQIEALLLETFSNGERPTLLVTHNIEEAYRLGAQLMVLSRGKIVALGLKEEIFRHPPTREVAQLTGCKNFSRACAIEGGKIEAIDWGCSLRVTQKIERPPAYVGIRAHHIDYAESAGGLAEGSASQENSFPCWLAKTSETPFRITLYLRMHKPPRDSSDYHLQAEVFKEKWQRFRNVPMPWHVRLGPDALFVMPE